MVDEPTSHGVFFLAVAWLQVGVALALGRWRRRPEPWLAAVAVDGGVLLVWLASRTAGVPESRHAGVGLPDSVAAGLEAVVVVSAVVALWAGVSGRAVGRAHPLATGLAGVALVGLVSVSVTPSMAGGDAGHGDGAGGHDMAAMQGAGHGHGGDEG